MKCLLLSALLAFPNVAQPPADESKTGPRPVQKIDGDWTVIYVEMDGKKVENRNFTNVSIKNSMVTCRHDGKEKTIRLEFGPHHMIRATEQGGVNVADPTEKRDPNSKGSHTHHGVYICSQEYLCLSLDKGVDRRLTPTKRDEIKGREGGNERDQAGSPRFEGNQAYGAGMVIILRRANLTTSDKAP